MRRVGGAERPGPGIVCYGLVTVSGQWLKVSMGRMRPMFPLVALLLLTVVVASFVFGCAPSSSTPPVVSASVSVSDHGHHGSHHEHAGCPTSPDGIAALRAPQLRDAPRDNPLAAGLPALAILLAFLAAGAPPRAARARGLTEVAAGRLRGGSSALLYQLAVLRT